MKKLNLLFVVFFIIQGCTSVTQKVKKDNRPNILFIMSDDHAYQAISSYDDRLIQTPNIDRLAEEGIKFTNACVTNSICAPSRATILTGKFSHLNGKIDNHSPFDTSQVTFPQLFKKAGYQTAMFGKLHFGNNPKGVDDFLILPGQGDYINPKFLGKEKDTIITGRKGINELAYYLTNGNLSYPMTIFLDENYQLITLLPRWICTRRSNFNSCIKLSNF